MLKEGEFDIKVSESGLFYMEFKSKMPDGMDVDALQFIRNHLIFHLNHIYCSFRDTLHEHHYYEYERGFPYFEYSNSPNKRDLEKMVSDYMQSITGELEKQLYYDFRQISKREIKWTSILNDKKSMLKFRGIYNELSRRESKIRRNQWVLVYLSKNIYNICVEYNKESKYDNIDLILNKFIELLEFRKEIMSTVRTSMSHGFTVFSFSLGIVAVLLSVLIPMLEKLIDPETNGQIGIVSGIGIIIISIILVWVAYYGFITLDDVSRVSTGHMQKESGKSSGTLQEK